MKSVGLNKHWKREKDEISLPFDALALTDRDFSAPHGELNSYYGAAYVRLTNDVPVKNYYKAYIETGGVCGKADVYADGAYLGTVTHSGRSLIRLPDKASRVVYDVTAVNTGRYTGCGIADGVSVLYAQSPLFITPYGVRAVSRPAAKAVSDVYVEIANETSEKRRIYVTVEAYNRRGRRMTRKVRTFRIAAGAVKTFCVQIAFSGYCVWNGEEGVYTLKATVSDEEGHSDEAETVFGVTEKAGHGGCVRLAYDNGPLGAVSSITAETRRIGIVKAAGYKTVLADYPREPLLRAADAEGINVVALLTKTLGAPQTPFDTAYFERDCDELIRLGVKYLRNHPCVKAYALPSGQRFGELAELIGGLDDKPVVSAEDAPYFFDYLGSAEKSEKPLLYCRAGLYDCAGFIKPGTRLSDEAAVTVKLPDGTESAGWDLEGYEGKPVEVVVSTSGEVVSLLLNGVQVGRKLADRDSGGKAVFTVDYKPGALEAVCFHRGYELSRNKLCTPAPASALKVTPQTAKADLNADGLAYFAVEAVDADGNVSQSCDAEIKVTALCGTVAALFTGDAGALPATDRIRLYKGRAVAAVYADGTGRTGLIASAEGLKKARASVKCVNAGNAKA